MISSSHNKLTIMTEPTEPIKNMAKSLILLFKDSSMSRCFARKAKYGGHYAVTRSLVEGLKKIGANYSYNPKRVEVIGDTVVVLSGLNVLEQAIQWKVNGKIKRLLAGPNIAMLPSEITRLEHLDQIDYYLHPSQFVIDWWNSIDPNFKPIQRVWFAGVNLDFWQPLVEKSTRRNVLIYRKKCPGDLFQSCVDLVKSLGLTVFFVEYGKYSLHEYRTKLGQVDFAIFLSESESQGIALFECWACDVPTLVWDRGFFEWNGYSAKGSSAPYLSDMTGYRFCEVGELEVSLQRFLIDLKKFQPRLWIAENGSDEVSARNLLSIVNGS